MSVVITIGPRTYRRLSNLTDETLLNDDVALNRWPVVRIRGFFYIDQPERVWTGAYEKVGPQDGVVWTHVQHCKRIGMWVCDSVDHNESTGCSNPFCFKYPAERRG